MPLPHRLQRVLAEMTFVHLPADLGRVPTSLSATAHALISHPPSRIIVDASPKLSGRPFMRPRRQPVLKAFAVQEVVSSTLTATGLEVWIFKTIQILLIIHALTRSICIQAEAPSWGPVTEVWTTKSKFDYDSLQARFRAADIDG